MLSTCRYGLKTIQMLAPRYSMNHIKDMHEQNIRVKMQQAQNQPLIASSDRVYKPTYTIQFNREGEVLLYSANPLASQQMYFKYPYILYESLIPLAILNYALNPLDMVWYWLNGGLYGSMATIIPRIWYFADFKWLPHKLFLLRGGRVIKVQTQSVGGDRFTYWIESYLGRPLAEGNMRFADRDQAQFLEDEGQLKYDLSVQFQQFKYFGVNTNNQQLHFKKYGTVHHPELFEAALKGYNIDTTDFVINTGDNVRYREGNFNV